MSGTRSVAGKLTAAVFVVGLIGCAVPQSGAITRAPREELQRSVEVAWDYDAATRAASDSFLAQVASCEVLVAQQRALETRMEDLPPNEWLTYGYMPPSDPHDP